MDVSSPYYSDPTFTVFKVPNWRAFFYKFLSIKIWGSLPSPIQRTISKGYASLYNKSFSRFLIKPYLRWNYSDTRYLDKFQPPNGKQDFETFQDFFIRRFKSMPQNDSDWVWPCEGLLCEEEHINSMDVARVKCDVRTVETVFGLKAGEIPKNYFFTNVFLHNKNYHRIHSPVDGTIERIQHIPGDLVVLRPWIYKQNPSLPAFRNERYNIDIKDAHGRTWYLSIVGGPAVGTIELDPKVKVGEKVEKVSELALFYLGSTCCMASPVKPRFHQKNTFVEVGMSY
jgi:phosphatidylserine decarboxylase